MSISSAASVKVFARGLNLSIRPTGQPGQSLVAASSKHVASPTTSPTSLSHLAAGSKTSCSPPRSPPRSPTKANHARSTSPTHSLTSLVGKKAGERSATVAGVRIFGQPVSPNAVSRALSASLKEAPMASHRSLSIVPVSPSLATFNAAARRASGAASPCFPRAPPPSPSVFIASPSPSPAPSVQVGKPLMGCASASPGGRYTAVMTRRVSATGGSNNPFRPLHQQRGATNSAFVVAPSAGNPNVSAAVLPAALQSAESLTGSPSRSLASIPSVIITAMLASALIKASQDEGDARNGSEGGVMSLLGGIFSLPVAHCEGAGQTLQSPIQDLLNSSGHDNEGVSPSGASLLAAIKPKADFHKYYVLGEVIGRGSFGEVRKAVCLSSKREVAVKIIDLPDDKASQEDILQEIVIMSMLSSKTAGSASGEESSSQILRLEEVYQEKSSLYYVMELVEGPNLFDYLSKHYRLSEQQAKIFAKDIAVAVGMLHRKKVVHNDIKPDNLVVYTEHEKKAEETASASSFLPPQAQRRLKLVDFGSAVSLQTPREGEPDYGSSNTSTIAYRAPELLLSAAKQHAKTAREENSKEIKKDENARMPTEAADMWSVGVVLYILLSGSHPFDLSGKSTTEEITERVRTDAVQFSKPVWSHISPEAKDLISKLLQKDAKARLTYEEVLKHPWISNNASKSGSSAILQPQI